MKSINPKNNQVIKEFKQHTPEEVEEIVRLSYEAYKNMHGIDMEYRADWLKFVADRLRGRKRRYAEHITMEMGKPITQSIAEIEKCALVCDYYAKNYLSFLLPENLQGGPGRINQLIFKPLGPVLAVMPWNYPFWQVFRFAAPALMAGNTAILKHSSYVPQCAMDIEELFKEAIFVDNAFRSVFVSGSSGLAEKMIADDRVVAVTLTGSEGAGSRVAEVAGRNIKKTVLELGGSDPFIVMDTANLEKAMDAAIQGRFQNAGQSCIAAKRFIVQKDVAKKFAEGIADRIKNMKYGDPDLEETEMGPMCRSSLRDEIHEQVQKAVKDGAKLVMGGKIENKNSAYYPPTLLVDVKPDNIIFREETFGPVFAICEYDDYKDALKIANMSEFGLGSSIWTEEYNSKLDVLIEGIESGAVFVNSITKSHPALPFGGVKKSGYGRELAHLGIREFMNIKTVCHE
ncbi:MAG: NAD-dependent succinate-semialdehyde dehydrogenase [Bacteroidales bacterium]